MHAVQQSLLFQVVNVLVHGSQAFEPDPARNLLERRGVAVARHKGLEKVENLFLPSSDSHGRIIANKKRTATVLFGAGESEVKTSGSGFLFQTAPHGFARVAVEV